MFIKRLLETRIWQYLNSPDEHSNTLLLSGARQVGKSSLIQNFLKNSNAIILNLYEKTTLPKLIDQTESFEDFERLLLREANFKPSRKTILVFDEAQEAKRIGRWIRFFKEKWRHQKVVMLGSILSNLFEEGVAYPVGHVEEITLRPFTFKEYLLAINKVGLREIIETMSPSKPISESDRNALIKPYLDYLQTGGMPEVVIKTNTNEETPSSAWDKLLRHYSLDVERHMEEIYRSMFISAIDRIADITCHPIKNSQILSTSSSSYRRLPRLLEVMEKWHLIHKVSAQTKHPESASGLASKRYLFDVGLTNFLINHGLPVEWSKRSDSGNLTFPKLQENFVANELVALRGSPTLQLNYYKETRNSKEIDFILLINGKIVPIEVKSSSSISKNSLMPMLNFLNMRDLSIGILVYNGQMQKFHFGDKIIFAIPPFLVSELSKFL